MSSSVVLNSDFKVIESSSGPIYGATGVSSILTVNVEDDECYCSGPAGSDVLLEYTGSSGGFTLETLVFHPCGGYQDNRTASVAIWVFESLPDMKAYSAKFNALSPHSFATSGSSSIEGPAPTMVAALKKSAPTCVMLSSVSGKYVHIKYLASHGGPGNVFFCPLFLVGYNDVRGTISNPSYSGGVQTPIDFNSIRSMVTQTLDENQKQHLVALNCLPPTLQADGLNRIHPAFVNFLNDNPCIFLVTNHNVENAKTDVTSPIHEVVAACTIAAKYVGYASLTYFYLDPTVEYSILKSCLNYLRLKVPREGEDVVLSLPNPNQPYEVFAALPSLMSCLSAQREGYITESLRLIHNQVTIGMRFRGVAKRGSFVKQQFLSAVESGLANAKDITEMMATLSLNKTSSLTITAATEALAKKVHLFGQLFCLHDRTESTEITPFAPCEKHYYNNELPFYSGVKVATSSTFRALVLDHKQPVLVYYKAGVVASHLEAHCVVFQTLLHTLGINQQVVLFDPVLNEFEDVSEPTDKDGVIRLFLKGVSFNAVPGHAVVQRALESGGTHITVVDYPVYNQGLAMVVGAEAQGVKLEEDVDINSESVFLPSFSTLLQFLKFYSVSVPLNFKDPAADVEMKKVVDNFNSAFLSRQLAQTVQSRVATLLTNEGIGQGLKYRFKSAEAEAKDARLLNGMSSQVTNLFDAIHVPVGNFTSPTAQHPEPTKFTDVYEELAALVIDSESAIANIEKAVGVLKHAQNLHSTCANVKAQFSHVFSEEDLATLTDLCNKFELVLGPLPVFRSTVDVHEYQASLKKQATQHYDLNIPQLSELIASMTAFYAAHKEQLATAVKVKFAESKFADAAVFLESYEDLDTVMRGQELTNVTGSKYTPFEPEYSTVCVFIDNSFCADPALYTEIMRAVSNPDYEALSFYPIIPVYVNVNHFDNPDALKSLFNTSALPAVRILHNMEVLEDLSVDCATPDAVAGTIQHLLTVFPLMHPDEDIPLEDEEGYFEDMYDMDMGNFNF